MGTWITVAIVLFVAGSVMGLKPNARERFLDELRMAARRLGLQSKLVACPSWLVGKGGNVATDKGKGMIAQYGLVIEGGTMQPCDYQIIDGEWRPYTGNHPANFALDKRPVGLPPSITTGAQGLSAKANFICLYWHENIELGRPANLENREKDLITLKTQLQQLANLVQNG